MTFIERTLRAMAHLNIGATIATAAWILWSGFVVVDPFATVQRPKAAPTAPPAPEQIHAPREGHGFAHDECSCARPRLTT